MKKRILIVGAGVAGQDVLREIKRIKNGYQVLGFIDDDPRKKNKKVKDLRVLGGKALIPKLVKAKKIDEIIIAIPSAHGKIISEVVKLCSDARVPFRIVPRVKEIIEGRAHVKALRRVEVEDLLGRPVIKEDVSELTEFFKNKTVLVTGAAGSIGSELSRQIAAYNPKKLVLIDWWENGMFDLHNELIKNFPTLPIFYVIANIQDEKKINRIFKVNKPDYVFHAAAYKHVPLMEDHPDEAVKNNIFGTFSVANASIKNNVKRFVQVSTDKAANPVSVMGATKLIAEGIIKNLNGKTKFMIVRFGNVLESNGSVIPIFKRQIENGGPVTVTDKRMTRYFMTIPEAANLILKAASIGRGGELFVLDMGEPVKIIELAENLIRLSGYIPRKDIQIVFTGIRKGEKLSEVLFNDKEKLVSTKEGKIFKTESFGIEIKKMDSILKRLKDKDNNVILLELSKLIPSFKI